MDTTKLSREIRAASDLWADGLGFDGMFLPCERTDSRLPEVPSIPLTALATPIDRSRSAARHVADCEDVLSIDDADRLIVEGRFHLENATKCDGGDPLFWEEYIASLERRGLAIAQAQYDLDEVSEYA